MRWRQPWHAAMLLAALAAQAQAGSAQAPAITAMCAGCHAIEGYRSSFPEVVRVPRIQGQPAAYLEAALRSYRDGSRRHPSMGAVARSLSDAEIAALAAHYARHR